jgi:hypothetical protein
LTKTRNGKRGNPSKAKKRKKRKKERRKEKKKKKEIKLDIPSELNHKNFQITNEAKA